MTTGSDFIITTLFTDVDGNPVDPLTVTALIQAPDGTQTTPIPTSDTVGTWTTIGLATMPGLWFYEITGNSEITVVDVGSFCVEPGLVAV